MKLKILISTLISIFVFSCVHDKGTDPVPTPIPIPVPIPIPPPPPMPIPPSKVVVHFKFNSAKLTHSQKEIIKKALEGKATDTPMHIVGHTDSQGSSKYNMILSKKRALSLKRYLIKLNMKGKLSVEGKGENVLLNPDKTIDDHKVNRRAEVLFVISAEPAKIDKKVKRLKK